MNEFVNGVGDWTGNHVEMAELLKVPRSLLPDIQ